MNKSKVDLINNNNNNKMEAPLLPESFQPSSKDIIIARGKQAWNHDGNRHLRKLVYARLGGYSNAMTKSQKTVIIEAILEQLETLGARFVKQVSIENNKTKQWVEVPYSDARIPVAQAFRDALADKYKSSRMSKQVYRKLEKLEKQRSRFTSTENATATANAMNTTAVLKPKPVDGLTSQSIITKASNTATTTTTTGLKQFVPIAPLPSPPLFPSTSALLPNVSTLGVDAASLQFSLTNALTDVLDIISEEDLLLLTPTPLLPAASSTTAANCYSSSSRRRRSTSTSRVCRQVTPIHTSVQTHPTTLEEDPFEPIPFQQVFAFEGMTTSTATVSTITN